MIRLLGPLLALAFVGFAGCANQAPQALNLSKATTQEKIVLSERISYQVNQGMKNTLWEHGLMAGTYIAVLQNQTGTFYQGEGHPIWLFPVNYQDYPVTIRPGGIWVPIDKTAKPRLYSVREAGICTMETFAKYLQSYQETKGGCSLPPIVGGAIGVAISAAEAGTIYVFDEAPDQDFLARLELAVNARK
ncbi:MAG: hypothetical protein EOO15_18565 [Chitinophagaceae bacterium]|nr:MAG: hypothetical protein EOO15_18565 [Chitinophagaceae bacterium]